jgi:cytochrome P450
MATLAVNDTLRPAIGKDIANVIADPAAHADGRVLDALAWLRRNQPLGLAEPDGYDPFWVVTRQADLRAIAMKGDTFYNTLRVNMIDQAARQQMQELLKDRDFPLRSILHMDPPDHPKYRAVASAFFHAKNLDGLIGQIRGIATEFADRMVDAGGECDFATDIAFLYPLRVIMTVLGVPQEDEPLLLRLTQELFGTADEDLAREGNANTTGADVGAALAAVTADFDSYFDGLLAERRKAPRNDMISVIANAQIDGAPMPALEARSYCIVAATAGHDTTAGVTAGGFQALCQNAALFPAIRDDQDAIKAFVEEAARLHSPSKITMRTAIADIDLCDRRFQAGDWIAMAWASGNRDEALFPDPDTFRIDRKPNKLISFGNGPHVCLGQHLARMEMRLLFEEIAKRVESAELAGEPKSMASLMVSGLKTLPVRYKLR